MLYTLPVPYRDATHVHWYEVLINPPNEVVGTPGSVRLTGRLGTVVDKAFVPDPDLVRDPVRLIEGREYAEGFKPEAQSKGAPRGNFRDEDLAAWLDAWGWSDSTAWHTAHPPEPTPEA